MKKSLLIKISFDYMGFSHEAEIIREISESEIFIRIISDGEYFLKDENFIIRKDWIEKER